MFLGRGPGPELTRAGRFGRVLFAPRNVTEFAFRLCIGSATTMFVCFQVRLVPCAKCVLSMTPLPVWQAQDRNDALHVVSTMAADGLQVLDCAHNELAKAHVRLTLSLSSNATC